MSPNISSMFFWPKRRVSFFLMSGLRLQDFRSYVQDFLKVLNGWMEDPHKSKRQPGQIRCGLKLRQSYPRNKNDFAEWAEEEAKLQATSRNRRVHEVQTDDKDDFKVTADALLKLEQRHCSRNAVHGEGWQPREISGRCNNEEQSNSENKGACATVKREYMEHIAVQGFVGSFHCGLVHKPTSVQEALKIPEANAVVDK